jgi:hypothetical protein
MLERLLLAPAWVLAVVYGVAFGVGQGVVQYLQDANWTASLTAGGVTGLVFGAVAGPGQYRQNGGWRQAAHLSPEGLSRRVRRAVRSGPAPEDPAIRQAVHAVVAAKLHQAEGWRRIYSAVLCALLAAVGLVLVVVDGPWWWLGVAAVLGLAAWTEIHLRRLRRRDAVLAGAS